MDFRILVKSWNRKVTKYGREISKVKFQNSGKTNWLKSETEREWFWELILYSKSFNERVSTLTASTVSTVLLNGADY